MPVCEGVREREKKSPTWQTRRDSAPLRNWLTHSVREYSQRRSVFRKDCYCIPPKFEKKAKFWRYAIAVFSKNASTLRVYCTSSTGMYVLVQYVLYVGVYMDWIGLVPGGDMAILWFASLQKVLCFIARLLTAPIVLTYSEHRM